MTYIDHWFDSIRKPQSFYDDQLEADEGKIRRYFYNIDMQGRLFLEETSPKNIATSIKDEYVCLINGTMWLLESIPACLL